MMSRQNRKRVRFGGPSLLSRKVRNNQGDFTINGAIMLLLAMFLLVLFITALGAVNTAMKLHSVTAELVRYIEIRGQIDGPVYTEMTRLADAAGISIESHDIEAAWFSGYKIQFGTPFTVTLSTTAHFGVGGILDATVPLHSTVSGRSEQYWK